MFSQKKTTGSRKTPVKFIAAWKSPVEVPPSPNVVRTAIRSPRIFAAYAAPTAWGSCVATGEETDTRRMERSHQWFGICRPRVASVVFPRIWPTSAASGYPRISPTPWSRYAGKIQSPSRAACPAPIEHASWPVDGTKKPIRPER